MAEYMKNYRITNKEKTKNELKQMIETRKKLVKEYDDKLKLAVNSDIDVETIKKYFDERNALIDELLTLTMFHKK
jgi:uncharacterized protein YutE (UPF0331/DUF86 family)